MPLSTDPIGATLNEIYYYNPIHVAKVHVDGLRRTDRLLVSEYLGPAMQSCTLNELTNALQEASVKFEKLELFKSINVKLEPNVEPSGMINSDGMLSLAVFITVEERKLKLYTGTEWISTNDLVAKLTGSYHNVFGRGEKLEGKIIVGTETTSPFSLCFVKPSWRDPNNSFTVSIFQNLHKLLGGWPYHEGSIGASMSYNMQNRLGFHQFTYDLIWRKIFGIGEGASISLRQLAGHSVKSSIKYMFSQSSRDDNLLPTKGYHIQMKQELAGFGGSEQFSKTEFLLQQHIPIPLLPVSLALSSRIGFMAPLSLFGQAKKPSSLSDRFFVGGPNSIRGFSARGIGPHDRSDALGGDISLESSASISFPLVSSWKHFLRGHMFVTSGSLDSFSSKYLSNPIESFGQLTNLAGISIGGGLVFKVLNTARLEINFSAPVSVQPHYRLHPGLQFGLVSQMDPLKAICYYAAATLAVQTSIPPNHLNAEEKDKIEDEYMSKRSMMIYICLRIGFILCLSFYNAISPTVHLRNQWTWMEILIYGIAIGGGMLRYWSMKILGKHFTFQVGIRKDHELVQSGPYRLLMHPSYTGSILNSVAFCWISGLGSYPIVILLHILTFSLFVGARIRNEEKTLQKHFGEKAWTDYRQYRWRLIPFIY